MGKCTTFYDELRFDTRDPEFTHVYCFIRGEGDCPFMVHGWHHKAFPKTLTTHEIFNNIWSGQTDPLTWEREAPRAVLTPTIYAPFDRVPVPVEQLENWRDLFALKPSDESQEMVDQITAHLCSVTQWEKVCPHCRAEEMFNKAMRDKAARDQAQ